jgi:hypothetical protein
MCRDHLRAFQYNGSAPSASKRELDTDPRRPRESRMCVNVLHTVSRLAGQARCVEVVNVRDVGVEDVERLQYEAGIVRQPIGHLAIPERRALRVNAPVLDERARSEMRNAKASKYRPASLERHTGRDHSVQGAGDLRAGGIAIREPGMCRRQISVVGDPTEPAVRSSSTRARPVGLALVVPSSRRPPQTAVQNRYPSTTPRSSSSGPWCSPARRLNPFGSSRPQWC